jgi:predicted HTH transcriptional regulator
MYPTGRMSPSGSTIDGSGVFARLSRHASLQLRNVGPMLRRPCSDNRSAPRGTTTKSHASNAARLSDVIANNIEQRTDLAGPQQQTTLSYPIIALQELVRNAVIHRNYEATAAPVMLTWYADRIEITNAGGAYGAVTAKTFGQPGLTDARNPNLASAAKMMGFVQRFGSGIPRAQAALRANGNPPAEFRIEPNFVNVTVRAAT